MRKSTKNNTTTITNAGPQMVLRALTDSETNTILCALRGMFDTGYARPCGAGCDHFEESPCLTASETATLCEQIGLDSLLIQYPVIRSTGPVVRIQIRPVRDVGGEMEQCEPADAEFFGIYQWEDRETPGGIWRWLADAGYADDAHRIAAALGALTPA